MRDPQFAHDVRQVQTMGAKLQPSELAVISHRVESKMKAVAAAHMRAHAVNYRNVVAGRGVSKSVLPGTPASATSIAPASVPAPPVSTDPATASARPPLTSTPNTGNMNPSGAFAGSGRPQQSQELQPERQPTT